MAKVFYYLGFDFDCSVRYLKISNFIKKAGQCLSARLCSFFVFLSCFGTMSTAGEVSQKRLPKRVSRKLLSCFMLRLITVKLEFHLKPMICMKWEQRLNGFTGYQSELGLQELEKGICLKYPSFVKVRGLATPCNLNV